MTGTFAFTCRPLAAERKSIKNSQFIGGKRTTYNRYETVIQQGTFELLESKNNQSTNPLAAERKLLHKFKVSLFSLYNQKHFFLYHFHLFNCFEGFKNNCISDKSRQILKIECPFQSQSAVK
jgi:hypothetical protein